MKTSEVAVNPAILSWAITRAGIGIDEAARTFPKLSAWLRAEKKPTLRQLESFSKKVHLPFGFLFLSEPPVEHIPFPHFRTGAARLQTTVSVNLRDAIQGIQQRQQWVVDYLEETSTDIPLDFVGRFTPEAGAAPIVNDIRHTLQLRADWAANFSKTEEAINHLVERVEEAGIFMVFNGVVENNTHRPLEVEECRGFVMVHPIAPFMFINNADGKAAQLFTIMHELAHIWLGISAGFDNNQLLPAAHPVEILCNAVAAELLVPAANLRQLWADTKGDIPTIARSFKASSIVIARRAFDLDMLSRPQFFEWYSAYREALEKRKETGSSGGDFYNTSKRRVGLRFAGYIDRAVREGRLLHKDAYRLTGLKGGTFQTFMEKNLR